MWAQAAAMCARRGATLAASATATAGTTVAASAARGTRPSCAPAARRAPARARGGGGRGGSAGGSGGIARATGEHVLQPDETLMAECKVDTLRGSGPGGQHRNKTETGVRLTHLPTDVRAEAFEVCAPGLSAGDALALMPAHALTRGRACSRS